MAYNHLKTDSKVKTANVNAEKYGLFTFREMIGNWAIMSVEVEGKYIVVEYLQEKELKGDFIDCIAAHHFKLRNNKLISQDMFFGITSNVANYIQCIMDSLFVQISK